MLYTLIKLGFWPIRAGAGSYLYYKWDQATYMKVVYHSSCQKVGTLLWPVRSSDIPDCK